MPEVDTKFHKEFLQDVRIQFYKMDEFRRKYSKDDQQDKLLIYKIKKGCELTDFGWMGILWFTARLAGNANGKINIK